MPLELAGSAHKSPFKRQTIVSVDSSWDVSTSVGCVSQYECMCKPRVRALKALLARLTTFTYSRSSSLGTGEPRVASASEVARKELSSASRSESV
jgi:hypothetical protein